jgi:hypothetical protein
MPTQDWYRPGKGYLRRDAAKFRYTKRNVKMAPPFSCSQKLIYCDTNEDLLPDRILKNYRNPALKKAYTCPLRPASGPSSLQGAYLVPEKGPLDLVSNIPPKEGVTTLTSILNLPTEVSGRFDLSARVAAPAAITNVSVDTVSPIEGISTLSSSLEKPDGVSGVSDLSAKVHNPPGISDVTTGINPPSGVTGLTSSVEKPVGISNLEAEFLAFIRDLESVLKKPSGITDLGSSIGVSSPVSDLFSTLKQPSSFSLHLSGSIKSPTGISDLSIRRPATFSADLTALVKKPSAISNLSIRPPAAFSNGLTAELTKPSSVINLTAEIAEPWLGVSNLSSAANPPEFMPALDESSSYIKFNTGAGRFVVPFEVGTAASTWKFHLNAMRDPDRFQILYDTSGASNLIEDCDIVADSLFVGDGSNALVPQRISYSLPHYVYVGTGGDYFSGTFNKFEGEVTVTVTDADCAPLTGSRTDSAPNGTGQLGVVNTVIISEEGETDSDLAYNDGNICLRFSKNVSSGADRAYLVITGVDDSSASELFKVEKS